MIYLLQEPGETFAHPLSLLKSLKTKTNSPLAIMKKSSSTQEALDLKMKRRGKWRRIQAAATTRNTGGRRKESAGLRHPRSKTQGNRSTKM